MGIFLLIAIVPMVELSELLAPLGERSIDIQNKHGVLTSLIFATSLLVLIPWDKQLMKIPLMRILAVVGMFSYSLYLIHYPLMNRLQRLMGRYVDINDEPLWAWTSFFTCQATALVVAWCFYRLIENPSLRWSKNFGRP